MFGITDPENSECAGNPLTWADDQVEGWHAMFGVWGAYPFNHWDSTEKWEMLAVDKVDWVGADDVDPYGVDHADVALYVGHGNYVCDDTPPSTAWYSDFQMGDYNGSGSCLAKTNEMDFGAGGDLDILVLYACNSLADCVFWGDGYDLMDGDGSTNFRMILGFHGITYSWPWSGDDMIDFVAASLSDGIGQNWLDLMYEDPALPEMYPDGPWADQCPTGAVWGGSSSQRSSYFNNGGWLDRRVLTSSDTGTRFNLSPCDPADGEEI